MSGRIHEIRNSGIFERENEDTGDVEWEQETDVSCDTPCTA